MNNNLINNIFLKIIILSLGFVLGGEKSSMAFNDVPLKFFGKILFEKKRLKGVNIKINCLTDSTNKYLDFNTKLNGTFEFYLALNHEFLVEFSHVDYVAKSIIISTFVPSDRIKDEIIPYRFNVLLVKQIGGINFFFDNEVARIFYNKYIDDLDFDMHYSIQVFTNMVDSLELKKPNDTILSIENIKQSDSINRTISVDMHNVPVQNIEFTLDTSNKIIRYKPKFISDKDFKHASNLIPREKFEKYLLDRYERAMRIQYIKERTRNITRVFVLENKKVTIYSLLHYKWGGIFYFKENESIAKAIFDTETQSELWE